MPSTYAHRRFGADVLVQLPRELREKITPYRPLYDMGLHGPDLMFYYRALQSNPVNRLGNAMHEQPGRVFFTRARGVVNTARNQNAALAYALGFVCHFALDSTCHPYVERYTRESGVSHCEIETEFDNQLMREDGLDPMHFFHGGAYPPQPGVCKDHCAVLRKCHGRRDLRSHAGHGAGAPSAAGYQPGQALGGVDGPESGRYL